MNWQQRKVLVTGGSAGIGAALTDLLIEQGCKVIICGRHQEALDAAARRPGVFAFRCDLTQPQDVARLADYVRTHHADLSVLINNAGVQHEVEIVGSDLHRLQAIVAQETAVNFAAPVDLTLHLLETLARQASATIVNITTPLALSPKKSSPFYGATKAALRSFTKSLRFQLQHAHPHIAVVEVQPPLVDTAMTQGRGRGKISPRDAAAGILAGIARGRSEIYVGKARVLYALHRWLPSLAEAITKRW